MGHFFHTDSRLQYSLQYGSFLPHFHIKIKGAIPVGTVPANIRVFVEKRATSPIGCGNRDLRSSPIGCGNRDPRLELRLWEQRPTARRHKERADRSESVVVRSPLGDRQIGASLAIKEAISESLLE